MSDDWSKGWDDNDEIEQSNPTPVATKVQEQPPSNIISPEPVKLQSPIIQQQNQNQPIKQPSPIPQPVPQPDQAPTQQDNWSFWSSVSAVTNQIKHAAEEGIDLAYSQIDPDYKHEQKPKDPSTPQQLTSPKFDTKELYQTGENVLSMVDKGFDFASDFIGNTLYKGYETSKQGISQFTKSPPFDKSPNLDKSSKSPPTSPPVQQQTSPTENIKSTVTNISSKLMDVSLSTLEGIGKNVYDIAPKQKRAQPTTQKPKEFTNMDTYFHDITGKSHIDALSQFAMNKTPILKWDVDELLEHALDEDEIDHGILTHLTSAINGKTLPNFKEFSSDASYLMFLCESAGNFQFLI